MRELTFSQYLERVAVEKRIHPEWRMGQTYYHVLHELRPDISEYVRGSQYDPFHEDKVIPDFLWVVCEKW